MHCRTNKRPRGSETRASCWGLESLPCWEANRILDKLSPMTCTVAWAGHCSRHSNSPARRPHVSMRATGVSRGTATCAEALDVVCPWVVVCQDDGPRPPCCWSLVLRTEPSKEMLQCSRCMPAPGRCACAATTMGAPACMCASAAKVALQRPQVLHRVTIHMAVLALDTRGSGSHWLSRVLLGSGHRAWGSSL